MGHLKITQTYEHIFKRPVRNFYRNSNNSQSITYNFGKIPSSATKCNQLPRMTCRFKYIQDIIQENLIISGIDFIFVLISLLFIAQKAVKAQRFSFVFSPICENRTISSNTSILTKKVFFCILKAKYQNILYIPKFSHQHQFIKSFLAEMISS